MRKHRRLIAGLALAIALGGCSTSSRHLATGATLAPSTTGAPAAVAQKILCAQVEGVTGLASDLNMALAAGNFTDAKAVITRAAQLAQNLKADAPTAITGDATTVATAYQTNATAVTSADPTSPQGAMAVQAASNNFKQLYSQPGLVNLNAYRLAHCS